MTDKNKDHVYWQDTLEGQQWAEWAHNSWLQDQEKNHERTVKIKTSPYGPYVRTEDLPLVWIQCLWCKYRNKIEFNLSLHMLERHREKLSQLPVYSSHRKRTKAMSGNFFARFEGAIEFRLDVAVEMAKDQNRGKGARHAIKVLQKRAVEKRKGREQRGHDITIHYQRIAEIADTKPELVKNGGCDNPQCRCHWVASLKMNEASN